MAITWINIAGQDFLAWDVITDTLKDCVNQVVPNGTGARIYPYWVYEVDPLSLLGKVTAALRATSGTSAAKVHCWTIGISSATIIKNQDGVPNIGGSYQWKWNLTVDVWGFFENDGTKASQKKAQDEARLISAMIWRNGENMVAEYPKWSAVKPLDFTNIQPTPFSDGSSVIVASGVMQVEVAEALLI